ncbi:MAG: tyrosine--tRNA ligase [Chitinophagales bacterium]|nr:tyrosine--tRNA ligase [Chitinophagales bacterium]
MSFVDELRWRGMLNNIMPGTEELLNREQVSGYIGFDPTADSLHIGSMLQITLLMRFQQAGHKPIALVGGATGMIGDPSGKMQERKLLGVDDIKANEEGIKKQLEKFLDFDAAKSNAAEIVNNNDWFGEMRMITFLRDVGKYLTTNYLLSKGFVKDRLESGNELSFTEFNYILMQAYDFLWLYENRNCKLQMGGSDQWGNITAGNELIHKKLRGEAYALTVPLVTKSDGTKFGKTESGNVWLDAKKTSVYKFYQFWLNVSDEDISKLMRYFSLKNREEIEALEKQHSAAPHLRTLQKALAEELTIRVHSTEALQRAQETTAILFGSSFEEFKRLSNEEIEDAFDKDITYRISKNLFDEGTDPVGLVGEIAAVFPSKGEARKSIQGNGVSINKAKITLDKKITAADLLHGKYLLVQKGKKNYYLIVAE